MKKLITAIALSATFGLVGPSATTFEERQPTAVEVLDDRQMAEITGGQQGVVDLICEFSGLSGIFGDVGNIVCAAWWASGVLSTEIYPDLYNSVYIAVNSIVDPDFLLHYYYHVYGCSVVTGDRFNECYYFEDFAEVQAPYIEGIADWELCGGYGCSCRDDFDCLQGYVCVFQDEWAWEGVCGEDIPEN